MVEVTNGFKIRYDGVPEALWMYVHNIITIPKKKKCKKAKWLSEEALKIAEKEEQ